MAFKTLGPLNFDDVLKKTSGNWEGSAFNKFTNKLFYLNNGLENLNSAISSANAAIACLNEALTYYETIKKYENLINNYDFNNLSFSERVKYNVELLNLKTLQNTARNNMNSKIKDASYIIDSISEEA